MKRLAILAALAIVLSACTPQPVAFTPTAPPPTIAPTPTALPPTVVPSPTPPPQTPEPTAVPSPTPPPPTPEPTAVPTVVPTVEILPPTVGPNPTVSVASFADFPGNVATGKAAPDFTARVLGGSTFTLSEQRSAPVLLFPTVVGCGDCIFVMQEITAAYPDYRGRGLKVVILNLYPEDVPETWQPFADYFAEPEFIWGVVNSTDFVVGYNIQSLGTTLLVDPDGKLVFRREYPLFADEFRQLFDLATR